MMVAKPERPNPGTVWALFGQKVDKTQRTTQRFLLNHCFNWWARTDSNRGPRDYEFVANVLCLGKSSIGKRKLQNKKVSCDSSLAQLDEGGQN